MNIRSLLLILIGLLWACTAYAAEGNVDTIYSGGQIAGCENASSRGCDDKTHIYNAGLAPSFNLNKYTRAGTKIGNLKWDYTIPSVMPEGGGDQGRYTVTGEYTCASGSTWNFQTTSGSTCWGAHTFYSEPNCAGDRNVASYGAQSPGGLASGSNTCSNGVCVVDYQAPSSPHFITADTNDNMMALLPMGTDTKGFVVNNYCGADPYWLERASVEPSKYLMIPTKCGDYKAFMDAQPSATRIENACHPVSVSVCPSPPSRPAMPPHPGCGGYAHGSSWCSGGYKTETICQKIDENEQKDTCYDTQVCMGWSYCNCGSVSDTPGGGTPTTPTIPTIPTGPGPTRGPEACNWPGGGNGTSCSFPAVSANSGQAVSINNNAAGYTGTLSATCDNGSWKGITTTCNPVSSCSTSSAVFGVVFDYCTRKPQYATNPSIWCTSDSTCTETSPSHDANRAYPTKTANWSICPSDDPAKLQALMDGMSAQVNEVNQATRAEWCDDGATAPQAASCSWPGGGNGTSCNFPATSIPSGGQLSVPNNASGYTGSLSATCNNGSWTGLSSSCTPVAQPTGCPEGMVSWIGTMTCHAAVGGGAEGSTIQVGAEDGGSGMAHFRCTNGLWVQYGTHVCNGSTQ